MSTREQHRAYIEAHLHSLLQDFVSAALSEQPQNLERFLLDWLLEQRGEKLSVAEQEELRNLKQQLEQLKSGNQVNSDETEDSGDDYVDDLPLPNPNRMGPRASVSAEAFGEWNKREDFTPAVYPKTQEQRDRIVHRLSRAFMFSALDTNEKDTIINAMQERRFSAGEMVITQGEDGNELFLVDSGTLECSKIAPDETEAKVVRIYNPGESFGELALLYNAPRAASIKASTDCVCWVLDRDCFNHIVKDASMRKRERYEQFLQGVTLLGEIEPYERAQVADALQTVTFNTGSYVIREGEWGDVFYIIEEGTAEALKTLKPGLPPEKVKEYGPGEYFGELALLKGEPRAATILATSALKCATLERRAFIRMIGPLESVLRRNADKYEGYLNR